MRTEVAEQVQHTQAVQLQRFLAVDPRVAVRAVPDSVLIMLSVTDADPTKAAADAAAMATECVTFAADPRLTRFGGGGVTVWRSDRPLVGAFGCGAALGLLLVLVLRRINPRADVLPA